MTSDKIFLNKETKGKKVSKFSLKITLFLVLLLVIVSTGFYFYYKNTREKQVKYDTNLQQIEKLQSEKERCSNVLSKESGIFVDYEYCRQLLQVFPK
jgi:flagellar basal body-associated protein FliL